MTLVVNFFGGPGTGKSTTTAQVFSQLKIDGHNVEIAHEYAKDLVWEGRHKALRFQPYIIGKQMYHVHRLLGEVEAVITDSPIVFGLIYKDESLPRSFDQFVLDQFKSWQTLNIYLERNLEYHPYNPKGRNQDLEEAVQLDRHIKALLDNESIAYTKVPISPLTPSVCAELVKETLRGSSTRLNN